MSPAAGLYIIRPKDAPGSALLIDPTFPRPPPPPPPLVEIRVKVGNKFGTRWLLRNAENNTFNVFAGKEDGLGWINKDNALFASLIKKPDNFRFESVRGGLWSIEIPGQNLFLTFDGKDALTFEPANGSPAQQFELIRFQSNRD